MFYKLLIRTGNKSSSILQTAVLGLMLALSAGVCFSAPVQQASVEIVSSQFGLFDASNPEELSFEAATVIPHVVGQRYGWIIEVKTTRHALSVQEEYLLPAADKPAEKNAAANAPPGAAKITYPRRNQVSQRVLVPVEGKIYGEWSIGKNEPAGHRHLQVYVEGQLAGSFEYDVR